MWHLAFSIWNLEQEFSPRRQNIYPTTSLLSFASFAVGNLFPALPASRFRVPGSIPMFRDMCHSAIAVP